MADQVTFRHPSGAISHTTERGAAEFARLNPEWKRMTPFDIDCLIRPGLKELLVLMTEVERDGVASRDLQADWDKLAIAMRRKV